MVWASGLGFESTFLAFFSSLLLVWVFLGKSPISAYDTCHITCLTQGKTMRCVSFLFHHRFSESSYLSKPISKTERSVKE